jgi:hypothetical protein
MPRPDPNVLARHAVSYLKQHPEELLRAVRGLLGLRFGLPIDALRYLARELAGGPKAPKDVQIDAAPPGVRIAMSVDAMGTPLRVSLVLFVEELALDAEQLRVGVRIANLALQVLSDAPSPVAGLLKSGALDLSKPGNLLQFLPRPPAIVDAKDDRITVDLLKIPNLAKNERVRKALRVLTPVLGIRAIRTRDDHLDVHFAASPSRLAESIAAARA